MTKGNVINELMWSPSVFHATVAHTDNLSDGEGVTLSTTVTGASLGDFVLVAPATDGLDQIFTGYVQAANTVEVRVQNESGGTRATDITINIMVIPRKL